MGSYPKTCIHGITPKKDCEECKQLKYLIARDREKIYSILRPKKRTRYTHVCAWCKDPYTNKMKKSTFCINNCSNLFRRMKQKILRFYMDAGYSFESEKIAQEISKLYREGKNYKLKE